MEELLGYRMRSDDAAACVERIVQCIDDGGRTRWLACINPHSYKMALTRPAFVEAIKAADWLIPDGIGIVMASRFLGGSIRERVTGADVFQNLNNRLQENGGASVFLLGSTNETLARIRVKMAWDWPALRVVGTYSPPFKSEFTDSDINEMVQRVNEARPDVLWVGMTAPKQEQFIYQVIDRLDVRFAAAIGAVFDFYIGRIKRAHPVFQRLGLEWLPRLMQEPRRLWRRTFISAPVFVWHVIRTRFRHLSPN